MDEIVDFEDEVLIIHPDEDIRKIEAIEKDEVLIIHPEEDIRKIGAIEKDEVLIIHPDEDIRKIEAIETDTNSNLEQASDSDGEIDDDEEANDLEEGEIKDSSPVSKKKSDIACRFFKRGSCAFGSQCQYLHVSDTVYKMFDTNPQKRNDMPLVEHHNFPKPPIFPPNILPPRPFVEPPISVPIKVEFHRQHETSEDNWEKGLEQARILIRNANLKKKNDDCEIIKVSSKNNKDEKINKRQYFTKSDLGNELAFNDKKYCEKNSTNSSFRKENTYDVKKSNYRYQPKSSDKWVDPWRRSKSPTKKRQRSLSGSPPSRSRKHSSTSSTSSISSSSSDFDGIYRRPYEKKSPRGQQRLKSRSRSVSQPQRSKKRKISPKHSFNGRRYSRSDSRSFSRSPYRKRTFSSRTQSRSSSSSSCSDCQDSSIVEDKEMKRISAKLDEQISQKSPKKSSELFDSDCETSEMTVSSASCTPLSSDSELESPHQSPSIKSRKSPNRNNAPSYSNRATNLVNPRVFNRNQSNLLKSQDPMQRKDDLVPAYERKRQPSNNQSNLLKSQDLMQHKDDLVPAYERKKQPSNNHKNFNNWSFKTEPIDCKSKNTASHLSSVKKPAAAPKVSGGKLSGDMQLLFMYQGLGNSNKNSSNLQKLKSNNPTSKPNRTEDAVNVTNKANSNSESYGNGFKVGNDPKKNIVLKLQPKSKDYFKPEVGILNKPRDMDEMANVKKETASKREQLLNKLKLIDDAIARKKSK